MELNYSKIFNKEILGSVDNFCKANNIDDKDNFIYTCLKQGFDIKKYGLLGKTHNDGEKDLKTDEIQEKPVEIEVIREIRVEVPVEVIKEVEKIVEVTVEKVVTKIEYISDKTSENELYEKIVQLESEKKIFSTKIEELESELVVFSTKMTEMENIFHNNDNSQQLQNTIQTLMKNLRDKNIEIDELKKQLTEQQKNNEMNERAKYLRSSNLDDNLYK